MSIPNFFRFASSELSQDAFILWLLEWANPNPEYIQADNELHKAAQAFVRLLLLPDDSKEDLQISSIECQNQDNNIDVLALIKDINNKQYAVIIEDKTDTTVHDNQLIRYSKDVKKRYNDYELHCVYFKTGNESKHSLNKIESEYKKDKWVNTHNPIFKMVLRDDILRVLEPCKSSIKNLIFSDFVENLDRIQKWTASYKRENKIVNEWGNTAWQGYYMELENVLNMGTWCCAQGKPIINKKGNKISPWEFSLPLLSIEEYDTIQLYLHLELRNLRIKAKCKSTDYLEHGLKSVMKKIKDNMIECVQETNLKLEENTSVRKGKDVTLFNIKRLVNGCNKQFIGLNYFYADLSYVVPQLLMLHKRLSITATSLRQESIKKKYNNDHFLFVH